MENLALHTHIFVCLNVSVLTQHSCNKRSRTCDTCTEWPWPPLALDMAVTITDAYTVPQGSSVACMTVTTH